MKPHFQPLILKSANFFRNKNNYIYIILVVAFLLRFGAFLSFGPWDGEVEKGILLRTDGASYQNLALNFLVGYDNGETFWAPGFPAFLAGVYSIFGIKPWLILLLNCFISTFSVFILYKIGERLFSEKIGLWAALLLAIEPHQIVYTQTLFTENLFIPLLLLFFLFFMRYISDQKLYFVIAASIFLGLSMYFRPASNYLYIPAIFIIYIFIVKPFKEKTKDALVFLLFLFITLSPWLLRNYKWYDQLGLTTNGGYNILYIFVGSIYNNQYQMHPDSTLKMLQEKVKVSGGSAIKNPFILDRTEKSVAMDLIMQEPVKFMQNYAYGCLNIYTSLSSYQLSSILRLEGNPLLRADFYGTSQFSQLSYFLRERTPAGAIVSGLVLFFISVTYILVLMGIWRMYKDGKRRELVVLLGMIIYFTLIVGTLGSSARFKLPITPFYLIFSAYGLDGYLKNRIIKLRR